MPVTPSNAVLLSELRPEYKLLQVETKEPVSGALMNSTIRSKDSPRV